MARGSLIVYEPLDVFGEKRGYWNNYASFYEEYWGGPTSPYGVWFGQEYENFRNAISTYMEIDEEDIEDCFFMKDKESGYYIAPFVSVEKPYILHSENHIPLHWFIPFKDEEREYFYTPWGFGGINYDTRIGPGLERLKEAEGILKDSLQKYGHKSAFSKRLGEIQSGIQDLKIWLGGFDPSGYLVLNYGEICSFIHPYTLKNERSVNEVWQMLSLINEERIEEAGSVLGVISEKWENIRKKASGEVERFPIQ
jgi:hypothetical protein